MITRIVWGLVTGTKTSLDGLILRLAKYYDDENWHLIGSKQKDEENDKKVTAIDTEEALFS